MVFALLSDVINAVDSHFEFIFRCQSPTADTHAHCLTVACAFGIKFPLLLMCTGRGQWQTNKRGNEMGKLKEIVFCHFIWEYQKQSFS